MVRNQKSATAFAAALMLTGGMCMAQTASQAQPATPPGGVHQPGSAQPGNGSLGQAPALAAEKAAAEPRMVDQQVDMQLQKIAQSKEMAGDKLFVLEAALGSQFEIALARQAQQKSQDPQVKQVAQSIIKDHTEASQKLMPIAQKLGVDVPMGLTGMKAQKLQIIGMMDGKMYDQAFLSCMDALHAHDVTEFRNKAQTAQVPDVKQFAAMTAPKLAEHHMMIKQAGAAAGLSSGMEAQPAAAHLQPATPHAEGAAK